VAGTFRRAHSGEITATFGLEEHRLLGHVLGEMLVLLTQHDAGEDADPLARAVGIGTATEVPEDPALARLFPDGYTDDPEASADFRRYTETGLRSAKVAALRTATGTLGDEPGKLVLTTGQAEAWLSALNDTRLVLGERLGVTEELDELVDALDDDDPRRLSFLVYDVLTYHQEALVRALMGGG
jgi:hypothetical protein